MRGIDSLIFSVAEIRKCEQEFLQQLNKPDELMARAGAAVFAVFSKSFARRKILLSLLVVVTTVVMVMFLLSWRMIIISRSRFGKLVITSR